MREQGQTTVEFVLALILMLSFAAFFINGAFIAAFGNYAQYAVYMSSRAYLSAGPTVDDQQQRAREVIVASLKKGQGNAGTDRWPALAKGLTPPGSPGAAAVQGMRFDHPEVLAEPENVRSRDFSWLLGVRYTFRSPMLLGGFGGAAGAEMELTTESWLGRETSYFECRSFLANDVLGGNGQEAIYDNGC